MNETVTLEDLTVPAPEDSARDWNDDGVVIVKGLFTDDDPRLVAYEALWERENGYATRGLDGRLYRDAGDGSRGSNEGCSPHGWPDCTPYMRHTELRALLCDQQLADHLERLIGEPAGVHLNLTGWVSTERDWHADTYLNPPDVGDSYAAVWIALDTIDPDSGPFEYVPGSHRWPYVTRDKIAPYVDMADSNWPKHTEEILTPLYEREIRERKAVNWRRPGALVQRFLGERGDVLIWHSRLVHRGSRPRIPGLERRGLIAHYSGITHRPDMPHATRSAKYGGFYFPITNSGPVR